MLAKYSNLLIANQNKSRKDIGILQPSPKDQDRLILKAIVKRVISYSIKRGIRNSLSVINNTLNEQKFINENEANDENFSIRYEENDALYVKNNYNTNDLIDQDATLSDIPQHNFTTDFSTILKTNISAENFEMELKYQAYKLMKDSTKVFEIISDNIKNGRKAKTNSNNEFDLDISGLPVPGMVNTTDNSSTKKEGIVIILDPLTNTYNKQFVLRCTFSQRAPSNKLNNQQQATDLFFSSYLTNQQMVTKDYVICSNGKLMNEFNQKLTNESVVDRKSINLPGWNGRPPLFIPSDSCQIQVLPFHNDEEIDNNDDNNNINSNIKIIPKIKLFYFSNPSIKMAMKRISEVVQTSSLEKVANMQLLGGINVLNIASLHGNKQVVESLIRHGANVNARSANARYYAPLHEAVIGGHIEIVKLLLSKGASQLVKDEGGNNPLHHTCMLGNIAIARLLMNSEHAKKSLLSLNNYDQKPMDVCLNNFTRGQVEETMRKFKVFVKPRVSLLERP
eukprot:gene13141-17609_t